MNQNKYKEFIKIYKLTKGKVLLTWCPKNSWKEKYLGSWFVGFDVEYKSLYIRFFGFELTIIK